MKRGVGVLSGERVHEWVKANNEPHHPLKGTPKGKVSIRKNGARAEEGVVR